MYRQDKINGLFGMFGNKAVPTAMVRPVCLETKLSQQQWHVWYVWKNVPAAIVCFVCLETQPSATLWTHSPERRESHAKYRVRYSRGDPPHCGRRESHAKYRVRYSRGEAPLLGCLDLYCSCLDLSLQSAKDANSCQVSPSAHMRTAKGLLLMESVLS